MSFAVARCGTALHALVLLVGQNELQTGLSPWGKVSAEGSIKGLIRHP